MFFVTVQGNVGLIFPIAAVRKRGVCDEFPVLCKAARADDPAAPEIKPDPEVKLEPEIKQEPFTIRGYFGIGE